jgi:hypothetical protein
MAQTILIKRSTSTAIPTALSNGELAYSAQSNKLFIGRPGGGSGDIDAIGGKYYTDIITGATDANTASKLVLRDGSGNFSAGTITATLTGTASDISNHNTNALSEGSTNLYFTNARADARIAAADTDDLSEGSSNLYYTDARVSTRADTILNHSNHGNITVSKVGNELRFSAASQYGDSDVQSYLSGGTGVTLSSGGEFSIGQAVATTDNVTFNNVTVDGTLSSDDITATTMTASGHVVVQGNLTVNGTTTTVNSNTVAIGDSIMVLNNDETGTPSENAGFEVERGTSTNVSLLWNEAGDYWQANDGSTTSKLLTAGNFAASFTGILDGGTF